jgi:RHS repeat-associated protein
LGTSADPDADHEVTYGYDSAGRLATVQDPNRTWTYSFVANSANLLSGVTSGNFSVAYIYEPGRNAITSVTNAVGNTTVSAFTYTNNALGQRTARSQSGNAFGSNATESFGYNAKGEVISSTHSGNSTRNTAFDYDGIGNRNWAAFAEGNTTYTANALNQYSEIDPGTPVSPTYDDDGNMLTDGSDKNLVWDGENRLVEVRDGSNDLIATYTYDGQSRRVKKVTTSLAPQGATEEIYIYDGWNRIATYSTQNSTFSIQNCMTFGRDLSGTLEGAGGVGGLLSTRDTQLATSYVFTYDANGNVSELIESSGTVAAHYEYDPFGNVVVATGAYAAANPWRFSTKPVDAETGYCYYGYRYYNPLIGRWLNRDPIDEEGGINLLVFVENNPVSLIDPNGLKLLLPISGGTGIATLEGIRKAYYNAALPFISGQFAKLLLKRRIWQMGDWKLKKAEVKKYLKPIASLIVSEKFKNDINSKTLPFTSNYNILAVDSINSKGGLGQYTIKTTSVVLMCSTDRYGNNIWVAEGMAEIYDEWDFDWKLKDYLLGLFGGPGNGREFGSQIRTMLGSRIPGTNFTVTSDQITFSQTSEGGGMVFKYD